MLDEYEFSMVFGPADGNRALFYDLQGPALTSSVFDGVNETLFAYGQTGSGKTHTIFGSVEDKGLLELFVRAFFQQADACLGSIIYACCYEVLGDTLTDLVNPRRLIEQGDLHSDDVVSDELFVKTRLCRYQIVRVARAETCLDLLHEARAKRTQGVSSCNSSSSRSHAVVHLFVQNSASCVPRQQDPDGGTQTTIGVLTLVDLAGTEKEHDNPSEQGKQSARLLNTSLSSLNRLLRKLQTGSLDESERRQSVLNKCLWEYLRPGCGVAMVFCVSPQVRHCSSTLSTLAIATDSKLIRSQRKSHYVHVPAQSQLSSAEANVQATLSKSLRSARSSLLSPLATRGKDVQPWGTPRGTPGRVATTGASAGSGRAPELSASMHHSTPSSRRHAATDAVDYPQSTKELPAMPGFGLSCQHAMRKLALQNTALRGKLHRVRARSAERVERAERDREQLGADLATTRRECESLRALFIRQQQQQIAFWAGPFMDMITPKDATPACEEPTLRRPHGATDAIFCPTIVRALEGSSCEGAPSGALSARAPSTGLPASSGGGGGGGALLPAAPTATPTAQSPVPVLVAGGDVSRCLDTLRLERDYWLCVANDLKREVHVGSQKFSDRNSQKGTRQACATNAPSPWDCGGSSTSPTVQESSGDPSRTAWSDTGSELNSRSLLADA